MLRRTAVLVLALVVMVAAGCVYPRYGAVVAPIMDTQSPLAMVDNNVGQSKVGEAEAVGIILVGMGEATISEAMKNGNISRIHHVDTEELSVLGIYAKQIVRVYGE
ncbi:MAG: TRL domain-containing protein [Planctomycetota bacterium]